MAQQWFIGLMSGTSLDGIDGALCRLDDNGQWGGVHGHVHHDFDPALREALFALQRSGPDECHRAALAANALALAYARVCQALCAEAGVSANQVRAIGAHGQTIRHQPAPPGQPPGSGYTLQLNQPALLAECTGIDVIADFRSRDVAAGGQGAPLVPPFHQALFSTADEPRAVVNIGGISNLTVLDPERPLLGFDSGPGNALLDHWCQRHTGHAYDDAGRWSASGQVQTALLSTCLADPYFAAPPPKSTGRDLFNPEWLAAQLHGQAHLAPADVQATLAELTARCIADAVNQHAPASRRLLVCGGGALNDDLMTRLATLLPHCQVQSTTLHGLPPLQVEAAAFAWLAFMHVHRRPANAVSVTGAAGPRILGACSPA